MNSVEKVYMALEELEDADDDEIREALPLPGIPTAFVRSVLPAVARQVPDDPDELDQFLTGVGDFCHMLRSDGYVPATA